MLGLRRRKVRNIVINPGALLRLSIPFIILVTISCVLILVIHRQMLHAFNAANEAAEANTTVLIELNNLITKILTTGTIGLGVLGIVCVGLWLYYSHRIFGPAVPLQRQIQDLINGNYEARVKLRAGDEFKELASSLNELAEKLQSQKR